MTVEGYSVVVDYDRPLAAAVAAGGYDRVDEFLTAERFPVDGRGIAAKALQLVCLERAATTDEVAETLARASLRAGDLAELLTLAEARPELQRSFPIVALGTVATYPGGYRRLPFLWGSARVRNLDLRWDEHSWGENVRFLAERTTSAPDFLAT